MIAFYRSAAIAPGKVGSAVAFAKEISAYVKDKNKTDLLIAMPVGGNPNRIGWSTHYENLGDLENKMNQLMTDPKYLEMVAKGSENFIAGSVRDEIWRTV
jgi:hypothetical protein